MFAPIAPPVRIRDEVDTRRPWPNASVIASARRVEPFRGVERPKGMWGAARVYYPPSAFDPACAALRLRNRPLPAGRPRHHLSPPRCRTLKSAPMRGSSG
jgi:hypothetical protein